MEKLVEAQTRLIEFFEKEDRYGDEFDEGQEARAKKVLQHLLIGCFDICSEDDFDSHTKKLNRLIKANLDADSIRVFMSLVVDSHHHMNTGVAIEVKVRERISAISAQKAHQRHRETNQMQIETNKWLDANMASYKSMDAAAQAITRQQPIAFRTARKWVGEWRKLRSAGRA